MVQFVCLCVCPSVCLPVSLCICLSVCLSSTNIVICVCSVNVRVVACVCVCVCRDDNVQEDNGFDEIVFNLVASQVITDIEECGHSSNNSRCLYDALIAFCKVYDVQHMHTCSYASWLKSLVSSLFLQRSLFLWWEQRVCSIAQKKRVRKVHYNSHSSFSSQDSRKIQSRWHSGSFEIFSSFVTQKVLDAFLFVLDIVRIKGFPDFGHRKNEF